MRRLALIVLMACPSAQGANPEVKIPADVTAESYAMPALPMGRVTLRDAFGGKHLVEVEIAATHDARTRGLMWRKSLADGKGMLFIFKEQSPLSFWMRNTLIPLDMLFIDKDLKVVGIVERAEPKTLSSRGTGQPSQFVLEVPGGWCAKLGVKAGSAVQLDGASQLNPEP